MNIFIKKTDTLLFKYIFIHITDELYQISESFSES